MFYLTRAVLYSYRAAWLKSVTCLGLLASYPEPLRLNSSRDYVVLLSDITKMCWDLSPDVLVYFLSANLDLVAFALVFSSTSECSPALINMWSFDFDVCNLAVDFSDCVGEIMSEL